jgi:hypothetical protein
MTKTVTITLLSFVLAIFLAVGLARAQSTVIVQEKVSVSRTLTGHADIGLDKLPADGITVELCSSDWQTVLASTKTDKGGHFAFEKPKSSELFYVRLSAPGVNPYQLRVRIKRHGAKKLTIHLSNAT